MRNNEIEKKIREYIDLNIFTNSEGELIDNKVGLVQDIYDFVVLDYIEQLNRKAEIIKVLTDTLENMLDSDQYPTEDYYGSMYTSSARSALEKLKEMEQ